MTRVVVLYSSITSTPKVRANTDKVWRFLASTEHQKIDISADEAAKALWRRNAIANEIPLVLVDGESRGNIESLEEAVEFRELEQFLGLDKAPMSADDSLLEGLSEADAAALAAELDGPAAIKDDDAAALPGKIAPAPVDDALPGASKDSAV